MTDDTQSVKDIGFGNGVKSLIAGSGAGNWLVYPQIKYGGNGKTITQGKRYASPEEMGLEATEVVMSLKKA